MSKFIRALTMASANGFFPSYIPLAIWLALAKPRMTPGVFPVDDEVFNVFVRVTDDVGAAALLSTFTRCACVLDTGWGIEVEMGEGRVGFPFDTETWSQRSLCPGCQVRSALDRLVEMSLVEVADRVTNGAETAANVWLNRGRLVEAASDFISDATIPECPPGEAEIETGDEPPFVPPGIIKGQRFAGVRSLVDRAYTALEEHCREKLSYMPYVGPHHTSLLFVLSEKVLVYPFGWTDRGWTDHPVDTLKNYLVDRYGLGSRPTAEQLQALAFDNAFRELSAGLGCYHYRLPPDPLRDRVLWERIQYIFERMGWGIDCFYGYGLDWRDEGERQALKPEERMDALLSDSAYLEAMVRTANRLPPQKLESPERVQAELVSH